MSNQASDRLKQNLKKIMQLWEERVRNEVSASVDQTSFNLQNSLPVYLKQLAEQLSNRIERTPNQEAAFEAKSTRIGNLHGFERASFVNYSLEQVIFEYHILRQVIFEVMEEDTPLERSDRDIIIDSIEQAVNDAATEFSKTLRDIQEVFMVTLAHDLRGPLSTAKTGAQLILRRPERTDATIFSAGKIIKAIDRLDLMVKNLLDVSRLQAGQKLELLFVECDLDALVREVVNDFIFIYGERFVVVSEHPVISYCSPEEIIRVIENLVTNAVKYGNSDTPITITLQETPTHVKLTVHNQGNPIEPSAQAILFQQFRRTQAVGGQKGWGLGLFLVKCIIEAHLGNIWVESQEDKGTSFVIEFPKQSHFSQAN